MESECHERAVDLLKSAQGTVRLVVRYTPRLLDEMERSVFFFFNFFSVRDSVVQPITLCLCSISSYAVHR